MARDGFLTHPVRGVELSGTGIVLDRGRVLEPERLPLTLRLEIRLPERRRPIHAVVRHVRCFGSHQALRFVQIDDADRLCLAEHLDLVQRAGALLN
jgi:hypothetical protein